MNRALLFLLLFSSIFSSCKGQKSPPQQAATALVADTLNALGNNIMAIYQDKHNHYWFASWEDGLYHYDGKTVQHFTTQNGLPHNRVEEMQEDQSGNLLFNTSGGLCLFDGQKIRVLEPKESNSWILQPHDLWFKSLQFDGKVYRFDGKVLHSLSFPASAIGEAWMAKNPSALNPHAIYTVYKDRQGHIWFGTAAAGACRFNGRSFDWISEGDVTEFHNGPSNGVRSVIEDKEGYFWFNSAYRYRMNEQSSAPDQPFYTREKSIGNLDGLPFSDLWEYLSIAKDNNQALWFVTYTNGVWRYDGKEITHFPVVADGNNITLFSIYKDRQGILWLGTHENGVYRFNGNTFERFRL